jgi:DNA-binding NarL/FixJ family response regulator
VFLANDHVAMRTGLRTVLVGGGDITVVGEASGGESAIEQIQGLRTQETVDVQVLDVAMPTMSGSEALRRLKRRDQDLHLLILTMHANN